MTETCRAAVFLGDHTYEVRELAVPDPPPGGALLQVEAVGLCGSDVAQYEGIEIVPGACTFPVVPGHETVGRVVKLAPDAALGVEEGDRVAVNEILMAPGPLRLYGYSDMRGDGELGLWGGYGEYMEIFPGTELHRMSSAPPAEQMTLFEPLASAVHWVEIVGVHEGDTVVVEGPGHQGLAVLEAVLAKQPRQVIVTGTSEDELRLDAAKEIGASNVVRVDVEDAHELVYDLTRGMGADVVFDVATATATVPMAVDLTRSGGRILLAGLKHFAEVPALVTDHIVLKSLQLFGGAGFTPQSMAAAVGLIESGAVRADVVAGEVFDLDHIDDAMALLTRSVPGRDAVRVGLKHSHS
jgi:2-desacetyl-2-hydroxyethyl bacteriochlorophyllide A dehydrogenase